MTFLQDRQRKSIKNQNLLKICNFVYSMLIDLDIEREKEIDRWE